MKLGPISNVVSSIDMYKILIAKDFFQSRNLIFGAKVASAVEVISRQGTLWKTATKELISLKSDSINYKKVSKIFEIALEALEKSPILGKHGLVVINNSISMEKINEIKDQYSRIQSEENYHALVELKRNIQDKNIPDNWIVNIIEE